MPGHPTIRLVPTVGVIANPASGRDIRRLVTGASVFDNAEKGSMVFRLMAGLGAAGVERVLMMPAADGVGAALDRQLHSRHTTVPDARFPVLEVLDQAPTGTADDTVQAVAAMCAQAVAAIVVLGGDGTHRIVAAGCGETPLCALSTGTNNVFPEMREATVAGLAVGLLATGRVPAGEALTRGDALAVNGAQRRELALVDVAVSRARFVGSRAVWRAGDVSELFVALTSPGAVGLSAIAGLLAPGPLYVRLAPPNEAALVLDVPLAPGLIVPVGVAEHRPLRAGERVELAPGAGTVALDGEREIERAPADRILVELVAGPNRIDVDAVMRHAALTGVLATWVQRPQA
jgi:predicted polyphosphate/ATP-dependent NAD kinase